MTFLVFPSVRAELAQAFNTKSLSNMEHGWHADNSMRSCRSGRAWFESCAFAIIMLETFVRLVDSRAPDSVWSSVYILYLWRSSKCRQYIDARRNDVQLSDTIWNSNSMYVGGVYNLTCCVPMAIQSLSFNIYSLNWNVRSRRSTHWPGDRK